MTKLIFIEADETCSAYREEHGQEVYLAHGSFRRLVPFDDLDLDESWKAFCRARHVALGTTTIRLREQWLAQTRESTIEPECVDDIVWCVDCALPMHADDSYPVNGEGSGEVTCDSCHNNYHSCDRCDGVFRELTGTWEEAMVCAWCRDEYYNYCDHCEEYYDPDGEHYHEDGGCGCESPMLAFSVRNDGEGRLRNDQRIQVTLPAGVISDEGIGGIARLIREAARLRHDENEREILDHASYNLVDQIGPTWQTKQGNFTKRLGRHLFTNHKVKLDADLISRIGCIAREHSDAVEFCVAITRDLNMDPGEYANEGSCWWGSESASRCALKSNGGWALRSFSGSYVTGRAWVLPLKQEDGRLRPTFGEDPAAFVVFNGYGELTGYRPARILAHMAGMTYRRIGFGCDQMYVNSGGFLVAPEEIAEPYTDGYLGLSMDYHSNLYYTEESEKKETVNV